MFKKYNYIDLNSGKIFVYKNLFIKIIKAKWIFKRPKNKKILIYDYQAFVKGTHKILFKNQKKIDFFHTRFEQINFYVLIVAVINYGFKNLSISYKKTYLEFVKPKIVFTSLDHDPMFFALKIIYPNAKYISDQHGFSKVPGKNWKSSFFFRCKNIARKLGKKKLEADACFVFNNFEKIWMSKIIDSKFYPYGSTVNNNSLNKNNFNNNKILFISTFKDERLKLEKKLFNRIYNFSKKNKMQLGLLSRHDESFEKYYRKFYNKTNWKYIPRNKSQKVINEYSIILSTESTLGFEALSKKKKCVFFLTSYAKKIFNWRFKNEGFFWTCNFTILNIEKVIKRVLAIKTQNWSQKSIFLRNEMLRYDKFNKKKKKVVANMLKIPNF